MSATILVAVLTTVPRTRTTRLGRQVTTVSANVVGEYLVEAAGLTIPFEIDARLIVGQVLAACEIGELVVVTGRVSRQRWTNRHGCSGEKWSIAATQIERMEPGSEAAAALGLEVTP